MKYQRSDVFQRTYESYLKQINEIDFLAKADILGLEREGDRLFVPVYNSIYPFTKDGIELQNGEKLSAALQVMICKYILTAPMEPVAGESILQPYREFKNAAPLVSHFTTTTTQLIESVFTQNLSALQDRCEKTGGRKQETAVYDLSYQFYAFPRIPVVVNFNDSDEMFPAACSVLYYSSAETYLDMECLCMTGSHIASLLTR